MGNESARGEMRHDAARKFDRNLSQSILRRCVCGTAIGSTGMHRRIKLESILSSSLAEENTEGSRRIDSQ